MGNTGHTMVKIRHARGGARKRIFYHIIAPDSRGARDDRDTERGLLNPVAQGQEKGVAARLSADAKPV